MESGRRKKTPGPAKKPSAGKTPSAKGTVFSFPERIGRLFTRPGQEVYSLVGWSLRHVKILDQKSGRVIFAARNAEFPAAWSDNACKITASKYFKLTDGKRETSLKQLIDRVVDAIARIGDSAGYFLDSLERENFRAELKFIMLDQRACFNSPVMFNVGLPEQRRQVSACFINSVADDMEAIARLIATEGRIFKWGSGSGVNYSTLRAAGEPLSTGGTASGPLSFMKVLDANAGVIKSGGKSRRAAKMCVLNADHPDIGEFIDSKVAEERKAQVLIEAGYESSISGEAYTTVAYQNANHSVRVTDKFMQAVRRGAKWRLKSVTTGKTVRTVEAKNLLHKMAEAAWLTGDPGIQFDTASNSWNTCPVSGRINASNPCGEFVFLDNSACNLSSINLLKYLDPDCGFRTGEFAHTVRIMITAQDILCGWAGYPTPEIERNSVEFRPLGLGYTNLGALLMSLGLGYDSDQGRGIAAAVTALMTGLAYEASGLLAARLGPFASFGANSEPMARVLRIHSDGLARVRAGENPLALFQDLIRQARASWDRVCAQKLYPKGFRNSQVTLLAPTGTISFFMDAVTTGIEPELSLVKYKNLVDGSVMKLVNPLVETVLARLGLDRKTIGKASRHLAEHGTLEDFDLTDEQKKVFATSFGEHGKLTTLRPEAHLAMMVAVQPFLSGAISKTVNLPHGSTVEEVERLYLQAWESGLKSLAVYRDGCKRSQPLEARTKKPLGPLAASGAVPRRRRLPQDRKAVTHKFEIAGHEGYVTAGVYEDGSLGEIFILMHKEGSTLSGLLDALGIVTSIALQYGAPLEVLVDKMSHMQFEPSGITRNKQIPIAKSVVDYIFRWLASQHLSPVQQEALGIRQVAPPEKPQDRPAGHGQPFGNSPASEYRFDNLSDAPNCHACGMLMERRGGCYVCPYCGETLGCS